VVAVGASEGMAPSELVLVGSPSSFLSLPFPLFTLSRAAPEDDGVAAATARGGGGRCSATACPLAGVHAPPEGEHATVEQLCGGPLSFPSSRANGRCETMTRVVCPRCQGDDR
jgi:hypothetical protein